jgi:hypothetical protein
MSKLTEHERRWPGAGAGAVVLACAQLLPAPSRALTWDYVPYASAGAGYETNFNGAVDYDDPRLPDGHQDDGYLFLGSASLEMIGEDAARQLTFKPDADFGVYTGIDKNASRDDNYFNYFLPLTARQVWQTSIARVSAGFSRVSTRDLVDTTDPNDPSRPGINSTSQATEYQERWYIAPSYQYQFTPTDSISLSASFDDVTFTQAEFSGRSDYTASSAEATWSRSLTPQTSISLSANASGFQSKGQTVPIENDTLTYGLSAGYQFALTQTASVGVTAGASRSDVKVKNLPAVSVGGFFALPCLDTAQNIFVTCTLKSTENNFVGQVFYRQRSEDNIVTELSASRSIEPNSDGSQVTLDTARAFVTKDFSPLLTGQVGASYSKQDAVASQGGVLSNRFSRKYMQVNASLTRRIDRSWAIRGEYIFNQDDQSAGASYTTPDHRLNFLIQFSGIGRH